MPQRLGPPLPQQATQLTFRRLDDRVRVLYRFVHARSTSSYVRNEIGSKAIYVQHRDLFSGVTEALTANVCALETTIAAYCVPGL